MAIGSAATLSHSLAHAHRGLLTSELGPTVRSRAAASIGERPAPAGETGLEVCMMKPVTFGVGGPARCDRTGASRTAQQNSEVICPVGNVLTAVLDYAQLFQEETAILYLRSENCGTASCEGASRNAGGCCRTDADRSRICKRETGLKIPRAHALPVPTPDLRRARVPSMPALGSGPRQP